MDSTKTLAEEQLRAGDPVFHPKFGFGVVRGILDKGSGHLMWQSAAGTPEAYYEIDMLKEGTLFVPIGRAVALGLRRLSNGLATISRCLASDAVMLPGNSRERMARLRERERAREPEALSEAVRDLIAVRKGSALSNSERMWLDQACRRLSAEAAIVDEMAGPKAYAAILAAVAAATGPA